jgi:hypothetical protein
LSSLYAEKHKLVPGSTPDIPLAGRACRTRSGREDIFQALSELAVALVHRPCEQAVPTGNSM